MTTTEVHSDLPGLIQPEQPSDREIIAVRVFDAPRDLVFSAWADPKHLAHWWGPNGFTLTTHVMNFAVGEMWRFIMHGPTGINYMYRIAYVEIRRPERIVYVQSEDADSAPPMFKVTVTFAEQDGRTHLTLRMQFASPAERDRMVQEFGVQEGADQTLERLSEFLAAT